MRGWKKMLIAVALAWLSSCAAPPAPQRVEVTLTEYAVEMSITDFKVGQPSEFVVTNAGEAAHEFVIMRPLTGDEMAMAGHDMRDALLDIHQEDLPPGATQTVTYTFTQPAPAGELEIACHIEGHYDEGMRLPISVE